MKIDLKNSGLLQYVIIFGVPLIPVAYVWTLFNPSLCVVCIISTLFACIITYGMAFIAWLIILLVWLNLIK